MLFEKIEGNKCREGNKCACNILHCMDSYASEVCTPCVVRLNNMYRGADRLKVVRLTMCTYNKFRLGGYIILIL